MRHLYAVKALNQGQGHEPWTVRGQIRSDPTPRRGMHIVRWRQDSQGGRRRISRPHQRSLRSPPTCSSASTEHPPPPDGRAHQLFHEARLHAAFKHPGPVRLPPHTSGTRTPKNLEGWFHHPLRFTFQEYHCGEQVEPAMVKVEVSDESHPPAGSQGHRGAPEG